MNKIISCVLISFLMFFNGTVYAGLQKETPYSPPSAQKYRELKKLFENLSDRDIERSINISKDPENIELINNILIYLKYKKLIKQTKKLPPIFLVYSAQNRIMPYQGGKYYDGENIIVLNANFFYSNNTVANNFPKNIQKTVDFVTYASILSHELMHYEDFVDTLDVNSLDSGVLSEYNAYRKSEKVIEYFMKMNEAEADEIIPIPGFYGCMQKLEGYFTNMRKNDIKIVDAAKIFLNNEDEICKLLGLDKEKFKMLSFSPMILFNQKNGGHIIRVESSFLNFPHRLFFDINILSGTIEPLNKQKEIDDFKKETQTVTLLDKNYYTVTSTVPR